MIIIQTADFSRWCFLTKILDMNLLEPQMFLTDMSL